MNQTQVRALIHCLAEEHAANGGHFASPETDLMFRQAFCDGWEDGNKTTQEALQALLESKEALDP